jgi:hypothetical protein
MILNFARHRRLTAAEKEKHADCFLKFSHAGHLNARSARTPQDVEESPRWYKSDAQQPGRMGDQRYQRAGRHHTGRTILGLWYMRKRMLRLFSIGIHALNAIAQRYYWGIVFDVVLCPNTLFKIPTFSRFSKPNSLIFAEVMAKFRCTYAGCHAGWLDQLQVGRK